MACSLFLSERYDPGCTVQAQDFTTSLGAFKKLKTAVVGISQDSVARHQKFTEKEKIKFRLLSDEEATVSKAYGVYKEKNLYGHKFMGIERTTFIISPSGRVVKIYNKVKVKEHIKTLLADLKELVSK